VTSIDKHVRLRSLARQRQQTFCSGYKCLSDYHSGAYECDFVSPYTKTAGNVDAEIFIMLQDWNSDDSLKLPVDSETLALGHTPSLRTNRNLVTLLKTTFGKELHDVYGTNLFPFIKMGNKSNPIPHADLVEAARTFGLPQVEIVSPKLVICLGLATFDAMRDASGLERSPDLATAIESPFNHGTARVWCQAHTGYWGQVNRRRTDKQQVCADWEKMKSSV
jgi:uracil-DNA glycosylase